MKLTAKYTFFYHVIAAFFTTWALADAGRLDPGNVLTGVFFLLSFFLYRHIHRQLNQKAFTKEPVFRGTALVLSVLFTLFYIVVDYTHYIDTLTNPLFRIIVLTSVFLGFVFLFYHLLLFLFSYTGDIKWLHRYLYTADKEGDFAPPFASRIDSTSAIGKWLHKIIGFYRNHTALCSFLICFICWLPYFLYLFPGVMTPDSVNQFEQVLGLKPYSNHHPVAHTMLIKLFYHFGLLFTDNMTVAFSFYTFFQMCLMIFSISFLMQTLKEFKIRPVICFVITLIYAVVPYHAIYSVTVWKDIPFAAAVLIFGCCLLRFARGISIKTLVFFVISGIMLCLFRSNGWYGFLLCFPLLLFFYRKKAKKLYPALLFILLTAIIVKYPIMNRAGIIQPDFIESLSVPTQQIAAVICNDRPLTAEQLSLIEEVVDLTYIKDLYAPTFADNMKELVRAGNQDYLVAHKGDFFRLWLELLFTYPGDFFTAYVNQTYGYYYPDSFYLVAEAEGISASHLGVAHTPLLRGSVMVKFKEISVKMGSMVPIYSLLWSMGVAFWAFLFCIGNTLIRHEKKKLIYYLPGLSMYLTVLVATPVATEFRYVYFMVFSLPFYLMTTMLELPKKDD